MKKLLIAALAAASFIMIPALGSEAHAFPPIRDNGMISRLQKECFQTSDELQTKLVCPHADVYMEVKDTGRIVTPAFQSSLNNIKKD